MPSERQYELVYIVAPTATDAEVESLQQEFDELIGSLGGSVEETDVWGRRKLAYEIGHFNEGIYIVQLINGPAEMVSELGRRLRVRDQVLRHMTVRVDEDLRKARRATERRKAAVARRREAKGLPPVEEKDEDDTSTEAAAPASEAATSAPEAGASESDGAASAAAPAAESAGADEPATDTDAAPAESSDGETATEESEKAPEVSNEK